MNTLSKGVNPNWYVAVICYIVVPNEVHASRSHVFDGVLRSSEMICLVPDCVSSKQSRGNQFQRLIVVHRSGDTLRIVGSKVLC